MEIVTAGKKLLTISESGQGRRTSFEDYRLQNRGGKGLQNYKNGRVAGIKDVDDDDEIILISSDGIIIRTRVDEINVQSRYAGGVRVMRIGDDNRVVNFTVAPKNEDDVEDSPAEGEAPENAEEASEE